MKRFWMNWGRNVAGPKGRWITLSVWIVVVAVLTLIFPSVNQEVTNSNNLLPDKEMSNQAAQIADKQFPNDNGTPLLLVWQRDGGLTDSDYKAIQQIYEDVADTPLTGQSFVPQLYKAPPKALAKSASEDEEALTTPIFFKQEVSTDALKKSFAHLKKQINQQFNSDVVAKDLSAKGMHVRFSGPAAIATDTTDLFSQADITLLIATTVLVLILLILLYRSPLLALIPLIGVGFAYGAVNPLLGWMASHGWITVDSQATSIMTVLLFGAGTDYCLFLVSRYRDELYVKTSKYNALDRALKGTGGAIMMSALTVVLGLVTLLLAHYASYDRFAIPFSLAIFIMGMVALTLLPALLAIFGRTSFFPFVPRSEEMIKQLEETKGKTIKRRQSPGRLGRSIGRFVTGKPWTVIVICVVILGGLATFSTQIKYTYGLLDSFPDDMPSREGFSIISDHFPAGELAPTDVIVDTKGKTESIKSALSSHSFVQDVSDATEGKQDKAIKRYQVTLTMDPYSPEAVAKIPEIKATVKQELADAGIKQADDHVWIGGETATLYDTEQVSDRDSSIIIPTVIVIIAALLLIYLRSIVAMVYLLATVLLSYFAALGTGWLLIHFGYGTDAMQGLIPLYSFVFLVALGEDYNIFMISSIWKKRQTMSLKDAVAGGVAQTGGVITSAGLILAGTFAVLSVLPLQVLVQFGTVTAIGVLLDTFIVRPLLVPAITTVLGQYAFWPGKRWKENALSGKKDSEFD